VAQSCWLGCAGCFSLEFHASRRLHVLVFDAGVGTRTAISIGEFGPPRRVARPAPRRGGTRPPGSKKSKHQQFTLAHLDVLKARARRFSAMTQGAVYALDAQKGTLLWKTQVDSHPLARIVGAPTLYHARLYVVVASNEQSAAADSAYACCTFRGSVAALDMATGRLIWKTYTIPEEPRPYRRNEASAQELGPAGAAVAASPTIDTKRNLLRGDRRFLDRHQPAAGRCRGGARFGRWPSALGATILPSRYGRCADFDSSPILRTLANGKQISWRTEVGHRLRSRSRRGGEVLWQTRVADGAFPAESNGVRPQTIEACTWHCRVWRRSRIIYRVVSRRST